MENSRSLPTSRVAHLCHFLSMTACILLVVDAEQCSSWALHMHCVAFGWIWCRQRLLGRHPGVLLFPGVGGVPLYRWLQRVSV